MKVDENEFERKRREAQEEAEDKERLRRLDIFKMKGYKRSIIVSILPVELGENITKKPRLDDPDAPNTNHTPTQAIQCTFMDGQGGSISPNKKKHLPQRTLISHI